MDTLDDVRAARLADARRRLDEQSYGIAWAVAQGWTPPAGEVQRWRDLDALVEELVAEQA